MDCVMIDRLSFERLKSECEESIGRVDELERENESLKSCNQMLTKLVDSLENIKFNLEKTVELMRMQYNIGETFQPFERDSIVWDEEYCNIKCRLAQLEDDYDDHDYDTRDTHDTTHDDQQIDDQNVEMEGELSDERVVVDDEQPEPDECEQQFVVTNDIGEQSQSHSTHEASIESWNECENSDNLVNSSSNTEVFGLLSTDLINMTNNNTDNNDLNEREEKPKVRRNRKTLSSEGVLVSTIPGMKRFNCQWDSCGYATNSSGNFQKHYRIHTGEKPYKCDFDGCNYSCSDPGSIKEHKRIHSLDKEFECDWPGCSWKFSTYKLLKNHTRACHTGDKPHKCDWPGCEKSFLAPYALRTHKLKHTGDRPFKCDVTGCKGAFTRSTDLLRHKRETHCTEKHFQCDYENCESKFYRRDDLRHHIKRKHEYPAFGRKKKTNKVGRPPRKRVHKSEPNQESIDEPKVVIDLNVAKVNQLRKSIQINFV